MDVQPAHKKMIIMVKNVILQKFVLKMHHAVRDDLLRYLQSNIETVEEQAG